MDIHKMTADDIEIVHQLGLKEAAFEIHPEAPFWSETQLYAWVQTGKDVLLVAKEGAEIVGFILGQIHEPTGKATIENLFVKPEFRGQGVGQRLLSECVSMLEARGATYVCLYTKADDNQREIIFFERAGFSRTGDFTWLGKFL